MVYLIRTDQFDFYKIDDSIVQIRSYNRTIFNLIHSMVALQDYQYISPDIYLRLEAESPIKHEYFDGEVFAMAGASDAHVTIALNMASLLLTHLKGSGCRVYMSDMKARVEEHNRFFYPDVMVTCDRRDTETELYKRFPKLVIEVLSDSTEAFDRGGKFEEYQSLETLEEYVLINQKRSRIDCFRRNEDSTWSLHSFNSGNFTIASVDFEGAIEDVYENVVLAAIER